MALNPVTGNPYTNEEKDAMANWEKKYPPVAQGVPTGTFVKANWSADAVKKAAGSANPLEQRPRKGVNPNRVNINGVNIKEGTKLSFRKTRKRKSRKSRSRK